jgi:AraC-like DNA-binding protein
MLEAGFVTKSNFNREFRRVTGLTPTKWQARGRRSDRLAAIAHS